ncbi:chitinase domain-containing 1 [Chlorella sorokiniana]|uniref:Chitinase domain-containing protein 1 n=1 Tax=Chlorella sorokiniana TaxID=3076 RepID=A0A2P6TH60_CHLSO|nr:chitinase domain-containing 1 [Chlorella sorokiniana]|eukprot:PRW33623.1 chitinase domain-containing 1 [Chlorella sorokiniana]
MPARSQPRTVLGYVTPWNGGGYDFAKRCRCRLTHVTPVWYQLRSSSGVLTLTGGHDVDAGWMAAVRQPCANQANHTARILPRVIFELQGQDVLEAFQQPSTVAGMLAKEAARHGFDGWVFEGWAYWHALGVTQHPQLREAALGLLRQIAAALNPAGRQLVLAVSPLVPAPGRQAQLSERDAEELLAFVDGLSVMTYDYSSAQQPGPNAPLPWVRQNADAFAASADRAPGRPRHKVLLGLNFYGQEFVWKGKLLQKAEPVLASRLLEMLRSHGGSGTGGNEGGIVTSGSEGQAAGQCGGGGSSERLAAAEAHGMGAAVWELGQGLDAFCGLL